MTVKTQDIQVWLHYRPDPLFDKCGEDQETVLISICVQNFDTRFSQQGENREWFLVDFQLLEVEKTEPITIAPHDLYRWIETGQMHTLNHRKT